MHRFVSAAVSTLLVILPALACNAQPQEPASAPSEPSPTPQVQTGELYIFNDSGPTLIPSNRGVTDNGQKLVSLPRQTYVKVQLPPGPHVLKPDPVLGKQQVSLNVVAGARYYVVTAYKPARSWAAPFWGSPVILQEITEDQAAPLLRAMKAQ